MRKRSISLIVPCLLLTLASATAEERAIPVTLARTQVRTLLITARVTGELQSLADPTVAAEIDGRILSIQADEGQGVHAGQLLALLETEVYAITVEQAEADTDRLQALLKNHTRTVRRLQGLLQKQSTAQSELDTAETELTAARAELSAAKARVKDARYQLARTKIGSPIDGVVQQRQVSVGDYVKKGDPLFQIVATDPLRGRLYFPSRICRKLN